MSEPPESDSSYELAPKSAPPPVTPAPPSLAPKAAPAPAPGEVLPERNCPHCGFRIVGKPRRGRCPECAAPLDDFATGLLQFADRAWVVGLSNGALLLAAATLFQVVASVLVWRAGNSTGWAVGDLLHGIAGAIAAAAVWMMTTSEPAAPPSRSALGPLARIAAIVVAGLWIALIFLPHPAPPAPGLAGHVQPLTGQIQPLTITILLATAAMAVLVALHLRTLMQRVPNDSLATQLVNVSALIVAICLLLGILHILGLADPENLKFTFIFVFPLLTAMSLILAWAIWALLRSAIELRNCAAAGENIIARRALRAQAAPPKR